MQMKAKKWGIAAALFVGALSACDKSDKAAPAPSVASSPAAATSAPASAQPAAASASGPAPSAAASAPSWGGECPKGSSGEGTFTKPRDAKGALRAMDVAWTGKTDDKGPQFRVTNKSASTILYGKMAVYFYDKAGKQIPVKDASASPPKERPYHVCAGNMFQGIMKPAEKAVITFSCVKKEDVPDGAKAIEAEMQIVGFTDATEKKVAYYWRNPDLAPDERKKGGVK